jgi:hypothetical protein
MTVYVDGRKCLNPNCQNKAGCRGLCIPCYNMASTMIKSGAVTWAELEKHKKCIPSIKGRKEVIHWLMDWKKR